MVIKIIFRFLTTTVLFSALMIGSSQAANWLEIHGLEPAKPKGEKRVFGFVQAQYQSDFSDPSDSDAFIPPKLIGPNLSSQKQFNVQRARVGVRGRGFAGDDKVNFLILTEFGNNAITAQGDRNARATNASVTLSHFDVVKFQVGLFKVPSGEEAWQGVGVHDYINFSSATNQLLNERFPNKEYTQNVAPVQLPAPTNLNGFTRSASAFRDTGVMAFNIIKLEDWHHSWAVMLGNGNGLNFGDNDDNKDLYLYYSAEKVFSGKGGRRAGLKFHVFSQTGKRQLDNTGDGVHNPTEFNRDRSGFGVRYLKRPWRASFEYIRGDGMVFLGPHKTTFDVNGAGADANGATGKASGWYAEGAWYIPNTKWEINARYDILNRIEGDRFETEFATWTFGAQYSFNKKTRLTLNYITRDFEAINFAANTGPNRNLDGVGDRIAVSVISFY